MGLSEYFKTVKYFFEREWHFLLHTRRKLFYFILITPVILCAVLIGVFSNPVIREIPIALIDEDNSALSLELTGIIQASPYVDIIEKVPSMDKAERLIRSGKIYGVVLIPADFSKRALGYKGSEVVLYYNNELFIVGSLVNKGVFSAVKDYSDFHNKKYMMSHGVPAYDAEFQVHPVNIGEKILFNPYLNYQYFFVFGLIPAALQLFVICVVIYSVLYEERSRKFLDIIDIVNQTPFAYVFGKLIPYAVLSAFSGMFMLFVLFVYMKVPMVSGYWKIIFATMMYMYVSMAAGVFIAVILRPLAFSAAAVYAAPTFAYAGISFPQVAMPKYAYYLSEFFPLTHYHRVLVNEAIRGSAPYNSTNYEILYLFLLGTAVLAISIAAIKLYSHFYIRRQV